MTSLCRISMILLALIIAAAAVPVAAEPHSDAVVDMTEPVLAVGMAACLMSSDTKGPERAARAGDAVLLSVGISRAVKRTTGSGFPSGHTAGAFAMATCLSDIHPKQKWIYYTAAAFIAYKNVESGGHSVGEVLGGAVLGTSMGQLSMHSRNGLLLTKTIKF